ncbi:hypothetical protein ACODG7_16635 [Vibrio anguillarum]|uniref:hypothetical protein n=1 Tax=Vibrio anguillarum TaxID=55601 RepID=UPI000302F216|nr:hypothetical protein [Vibrio anguillarum]OEE31477.1 hypothetical protein A1QW_12610 [Vibrio anguillarum]OEF91891.1 hypothetical protein A1QY_13935 [Vibrio anguillarum]
MRDIIISIVSGLAASIVAVIITFNQVSKSDGNFQGKTTAEIRALEEQVKKLSDKVDDLNDRSNGLDSLVFKTKRELGDSVESAKQDLNSDMLELKDRLSEHSKELEIELNKLADTKQHQINALNIPSRVVLDHEHFSEGQQRYLFERQAVIRLVSVDPHKEKSTFELIYPDGKEKKLIGLSEGDRVHFEFQAYKFILDVNSVMVFGNDDNQIRSSTISITRSI